MSNLPNTNMNVEQKAGRISFAEQHFRSFLENQEGKQVINNKMLHSLANTILKSLEDASFEQARQYLEKLQQEGTVEKQEGAAIEATREITNDTLRQIMNESRLIEDAIQKTIESIDNFVKFKEKRSSPKVAESFKTKWSEPTKVKESPKSEIKFIDRRVAETQVQPEVQKAQPATKPDQTAYDELQETQEAELSKTFEPDEKEQSAVQEIQKTDKENSKDKLYEAAAIIHEWVGKHENEEAEPEVQKEPSVVESEPTPSPEKVVESPNKEEDQTEKIKARIREFCRKYGPVPGEVTFDEFASKSKLEGFVRNQVFWLLKENKIDSTVLQQYLNHFYHRDDRRFRTGEATFSVPENSPFKAQYDEYLAILEGKEPELQAQAAAAPQPEPASLVDVSTQQQLEAPKPAPEPQAGSGELAKQGFWNQLRSAVKNFVGQALKKKGEESQERPRLDGVKQEEMMISQTLNASSEKPLLDPNLSADELQKIINDPNRSKEEKEEAYKRLGFKNDVLIRAMLQVK